MDMINWEQVLPVIFAGLMGLSILIYVVLDGYDLGVGVLTAFATPEEKDRMIASIGPFWDANETWLVLAVGLLLVAFPAAHGVILTTLYLPVMIMLIGLIFRGVAFEFRAKVKPEQKRWWNLSFFAGSLITALSQGYMLGIYVLGLDQSWPSILFATGVAVALCATYGFLGAAWLIYKAEDALQQKAVSWAKRTLIVMALGMGTISLVTPFASDRIFDKWFSVPEILLLAPLPLVAGGLFVGLWFMLRHMPFPKDRFSWAPLVMGAGAMITGFAGLAYSFYPYVVPERLTIYEAASATESLGIILVGTLFVLPIILGYTVFAYTVFRGKATALSYK
ncbi:cytochrome d ubiquinol oxidase subunit II [Pararhizobium sp. IMCC21322]|uniref:cytochrome d ubiquinol oxidase subunit II n=1 Tax=Pararhizobium sp. IMCC21322 TaxID=3067903 RepID=UPI002740B940|nr:cytochrome d ubiquinol oxidase subunit II [Pararhizobium sp. IMCC21322]